MKYKIWFSRNRKPSEAWAVEEVGVQKPQTYLAPRVEVFGEIAFVLGKPEDTPQSWAETSGYLAIDGTTNGIMIRCV